MPNAAARAPWPRNKKEGPARALFHLNVKAAAEVDRRSILPVRPGAHDLEMALVGDVVARVHKDVLGL